jgi:hypothetical protein
MRALLPRAALLAASLVVIPALAGPESRQLQSFTKVDVKVPLDVTIRPGKDFSLVLNLNDGAMADKISTEVRGDTLYITSTERSWHLKGKNTATITMPDVRGITISGSGNVDATGFEQGSTLAMAIAGSGDITYSGKTKTLAVAVAGSGNVKLSGSTDTLSVSIEGSGDFRGSDFTAKNVSVSLSGSGDADLRVSGGTAQFAVNGSGDIRWSGDASAVSAVTHGSGSIKKKH